MPGAAAPFIDSWAPPQFVAGTGGAQGPERTIFANTGSTQMSSQGQASQQTYDTYLAHKLAAVIIAALAVVYVLQQLGFRFVVAAGVGR